MFRRKRISDEQEAELAKAVTQMDESEKELATAYKLASRIKEIREENHFAEQFVKALGG